MAMTAEQEYATQVAPMGAEKVQHSGAACTPYGAIPEATKPYWYIVQPEDLGSFWQIPVKFALPTKEGQTWTWQVLRNANIDWPGGFAQDGNGACQLQGLFVGAKLHVPAEWPDPRAGVKTQPKTGTDPREPKGPAPGIPTKGTATAALIVAGVGVVGILTLAWIANRRKA
jgi:hypothetical protein